MLQIREILLSGHGVPDASVKFLQGPNVIAGESDTGKSYLRHCLDYIFGSDELKKKIPQAEPYHKLSVEFQNSNGEYLSLVRDLSGGDLYAHYCPISSIDGAGEIVVNRRRGLSRATDVTSVLFPFAGIPEAQLRRNSDGKTQRLTIRTILPVLIVDEVAVIEEQSPIIGSPGYDDTARKRMFAYMLSGKDDSGIIATEKKAIVAARLNAQIALIDDLLAPLEQRLHAGDGDAEKSIRNIDEAIVRASEELMEIENEKISIIESINVAHGIEVKANTQLLAIDQLLIRYKLLKEHYESDLKRLDFISESAYYFNNLQEVSCPLCGQNMGEEHNHDVAYSSADIYAAARAEAAKILAQRHDLNEAIVSLQHRRDTQEAERLSSAEVIRAAERRLESIVQPAIASGAIQLQRLNGRRLELEIARSNSEQVESLRLLRARIDEAAASGMRGKKEWEELPSTSLTALCKEIEAVLKEWKWDGDGRVEFDQKAYDFKVDGQPRQSHGKGVRAVLYSAFVIALIRYCHREGLPHPGFVVIDSPLTSYKKRGANVPGADAPVSQSVEAAFWDSLTRIPKSIQIVIIENKEPPQAVADAVHYDWFAGDEAGPGDRVGFIPKAPPRRVDE